MSDPVSALKNISDDTGLVTISEIGPIGMITLRGDLSDKALVKAAVAAGGVNLPEQGHCNTQGSQGIAWMSPDELLIICAYADVQDRLADLREKLAGSHALVVNVSDARAVFDIKGDHAREVIAKLAPVDMHPDQFNGTMFRRTRFAQVPAAFWMPDGTSARIVCFRSVAQYMFDLLKTAAMPGSEVRHYA
ncbi:sarcosine oxidase subunit gamma family protein [Sulfitobacter sp. PR48]|uniref:sarcosine oxidase subunit gamma n=1 Tax=Sulfitobacter sp. PR48 TaxID=3028383 RepID=UPI00237BAA24|nr:sarcosine oxidase subunit gamma family protein [Sulfitobacter sp. PR48]MDD9722467.1 sarcosine oxidase subunit gamma family protein [Sulfitobacter sp. PR48]